MEYRWREGTRFPVPAEVAGAELERIGAENGGAVTPAAVVEAARDPDAPLHPVFPWDDAIAAERHREDVARRLIRSVFVVVEDARTGEPRPSLGYVHVHLGDGGPAYVTTARALSDVDLREQAIADALAGLRGWQRRHAALEELADVLAAVDRAAARAERRLRRAAAPQAQAI